MNRKKNQIVIENNDNDAMLSIEVFFLSLELKIFVHSLLPFSLTFYRISVIWFHIFISSCFYVWRVGRISHVYKNLLGEIKSTLTDS